MGAGTGRIAGMPFIVKDVETTPNPNALKFVLDRAIVKEPVSFFNSEAAKGHVLGSQLFGVKGVASVLLLGDFVTINKAPKATWRAITPKVTKILQGASEG